MLEIGSHGVGRICKSERERESISSRHLVNMSNGLELGLTMT